MKWFWTKNDGRARHDECRLALGRDRRLYQAEMQALQCRLDQLSHDPGGGNGIRITCGIPS
ncbi:MAG: hypothetical protein VB086_07955 [Clostridiaceae bacterium]|nr:hypothetical protein [Clostridiaceae bacterium]